MSILEGSATHEGTARADDSFAMLAGPFRRELLAYCYRMVGSIHEAEDLVQETMLRGWRAYPRFEGRSSLRQWLYRIATRVCLDALDKSGRRALPSGLGAPETSAQAGLRSADPAQAWLEPVPDRLLGAPIIDPAEAPIGRADVRLAFVAALQELSAKQRAVLLLRDVLGLRASETAAILDTTTTAVNSALVRARDRLRDSSVAADNIAEPPSGVLQRMLDDYVHAFEHGDVSRLVSLLRADIELEMPPTPTWFTGHDAVIGFLRDRVLGPPGTFRMFATRANGQPAVAAYLRDASGGYAAHNLNVLTPFGDKIARIVVFGDVSLFPQFDLPLRLPDLSAHHR
jgi:RNA polymerase sigma-70 factor (ECF subfamily)